MLSAVWPRWGGRRNLPLVPFLLPNTLPPDQSVPWAWGEWHEILSLLKMCIIKPTTTFVPNIMMGYVDKKCNTYLLWKCYITHICLMNLNIFFHIWLSSCPKISCKIQIVFILPLIHISVRIFFQTLATCRSPISSNGCYLQLKKGK